MFCADDLKSMRASKDKQSGFSPSWMRLAYCFIIIFISLFILNICASFLWERERKRGARHVVMAQTQSEAPMLTLICQENIVGPHYDFLINEVRGDFERFAVSPRNPIDFSRPVPCAAYPTAMQDVAPRLKNLPQKRHSEKRIVFIGDSFTFGEGVQSGSAFPEVLDRYFKDFGSNSPYRAINFGRIGFDLPDLYNISFKAALRAKPDVIYYVWIANDTPPGGLPYPGILGLSAFYSSRAHIDSLKGFALGKLIQTIIIRRRIHSGTLDWYHRVHGPENAKGMKEFQEYIRRMKKEARERGAEFRLALFPMLIGNKNNYPLSDAHAAVMRIARAEGVPALDLTSAVLDRPAPELWVHPANQHPSVYAHRAAARALAHAFGISSKTLPLPVCMPGPRKRLSLQSALPCEILEFPEHALLFTNDRDIAEIIKEAFGRKPRFISSERDARKACPGNSKCVFIKSTRDPKKYLNPSKTTCLPPLHFENKTVKLCPINL